MAYQKQPVQSGEVISSDWGNHIQTQYDEAKADLDAHLADTTKHVTLFTSNPPDESDSPNAYPIGLSIAFYFRGFGPVGAEAIVKTIKWDNEFAVQHIYPIDLGEGILHVRTFYSNAWTPWQGVIG